MASSLPGTPQEASLGSAMDTLFEHHIIQNSALATEALWTCSSACYSETNKAHGLALQSAYLVLPLVFHQSSAKAFASKNRPGILPKVLAETRGLTIGLQQRMQAMATLTSQALNLGFASGCLLFDAEHDDGPEVLPGKRHPNVNHADEDVKMLLFAAKRLGVVFGEVTFAQLCAQLRVRF